jgi:hypothetical protein
MLASSGHHWTTNRSTVVDVDGPASPSRFARPQSPMRSSFEKVEVLGPTELWLHPSVEAEERGWAAAMSGEFVVEMRQTGRGERSRT